MAGLTDTQLACVRYLHRNGGHVSAGEGFSLTVVRKLEELGIVTVHRYPTAALYERRGMTWIATLTPARLDMAKKFSVPVPYGLRAWFEATRLMDPTESDKVHDTDMTRAVRAAWWQSRGDNRSDMVLTAPLAVLTAIGALVESTLRTPSPYNRLDKDDARAYLASVDALK